MWVEGNQWYEYRRLPEPKKCKGCCEKLDEIRRLKTKLKKAKKAKKK